ncbi:MAG TPA: hypothetical protein VK470_18680 [Bacteroidota bacterium]|nr:hypothetical protein [Bacteroidota bacterium]
MNAQKAAESIKMVKDFSPGNAPRRARTVTYAAIAVIVQKSIPKKENCQLIPLCLKIVNIAYYKIAVCVRRYNPRHGPPLSDPIPE